MPSAARRCGRSRANGRPSNQMLPACGLTKPQSTLSRVVFPAPFGPMTPATWRGLTVSDGPVERREPAKAHRHAAYVEGAGPRRLRRFPRPFG